MVSDTAMPFIVGGASAMLASSFVHPIDLTKVRLQLFKTLNPDVALPSGLELMSRMYKEEGVRALYTGLSAAMLRQAVYGTARIGLHRTFSNKLEERNNGLPLSFGLKALSGMGSGSLAVCVGTPMDVALVRMQADSMKPAGSRRGYTNVFDALLRIAKEEGASKLYSGLAPNILRGMSINVGMMACYDQAKEMVSDHVFHDKDRRNPSLPTQLVASCIAGFTASAFSLPFDLLKSRMRKFRRRLVPPCPFSPFFPSPSLENSHRTLSSPTKTEDGGKFKNIADAFTQVLRQEGILSFWTGFGAYYLRTAPHAMIILLSTAPITVLYKQAFSRN